MGGNNFGVSHKYLLSLYVNSLIKDGVLLLPYFVLLWFQNVSSNISNIGQLIVAVIGLGNTVWLFSVWSW